MILVQLNEELEITTQLHDVYNSELQDKFKPTHAREIFKVRHPGIEGLWFLLIGECIPICNCLHLNIM